MKILGLQPGKTGETAKADYAPAQQPAAPPPKMAPLDERPNAEKLKVQAKPSGRSVFALQVQGEESVLVQQKLAAMGLEAPPKTGAKNIDELLRKLPVQSEIGRILHAVERPGKIPLASLEKIAGELSPHYVEAAEKIAHLTRFLNPVELYTIDDPPAVKRKFLDALENGEKLENPRFTYRNSVERLKATLAAEGTSLDALEKELEVLEKKTRSLDSHGDLDRVARLALLSKIADDRATLELARGLEAGDDAKVRDAFAVKYGGKVDAKLYEAARIVYGYLVEHQAHAKKKKEAQVGKGKLPETLAAHLTRSETMTSADLKQAMEWMLARYYEHYEAQTGKRFPPDLKYRVVVSEQYSAIDVRDKSSEGPVIGIPEKPRTYKKNLELLRHEIDQHVRQSLNGRLMFGFGGGALKVDEEVWYEGLAKHAEIGFMREMFGDETEPSLPYFTFAIKMAEEGMSFVETFMAQRALRVAAGNSEKTAAENAWNAAYRAFRGHSDTSNALAFALPKDQAYLRGWMLQSQLAERGLSHLNEAAIAQLEGLRLVARFEFSRKDLLFPDLNLTERWFEEVLRPRIEAEIREAQV